MDQKSEPRVRMNVKQSAKGAVQFDITAESPTVEESGKLLGEAIDRVKVEIEARGLKIAAD